MIDFVARLEAGEAAAFYKKELDPFTSTPIPPGAVDFYAKLGATHPSWLPARATGIALSQENTLYQSPDGVTVWDANHARFGATAEVGLGYQPGSLRNVPPDVHRYRVIIYF